LKAQAEVEVGDRKPQVDVAGHFKENNQVKKKNFDHRNPSMATKLGGW